MSDHRKVMALSLAVNGLTWIVASLLLGHWETLAGKAVGGLLLVGGIAALAFGMAIFTQ